MSRELLQGLRKVKQNILRPLYPWLFHAQVAVLEQKRISSLPWTQTVRPDESGSSGSVSASLEILASGAGSPMPSVLCSASDIVCGKQNLNIVAGWDLHVV